MHSVFIGFFDLLLLVDYRNKNAGVRGARCTEIVSVS